MLPSCHVVSSKYGVFQIWRRARDLFDLSNPVGRRKKKQKKRRERKEEEREEKISEERKINCVHQLRGWNRLETLVESLRRWAFYKTSFPDWLHDWTVGRLCGKQALWQALWVWPVNHTHPEMPQIASDRPILRYLSWKLNWDGCGCFYTKVWHWQAR